MSDLRRIRHDAVSGRHDMLAWYREGHRPVALRAPCRLPYGLTESELEHAYGSRAAPGAGTEEPRPADLGAEGFESPAVLQCRVGTPSSPGSGSEAGGVSRMHPVEAVVLAAETACGIAAALGFWPFMGGAS